MRRLPPGCERGENRQAARRGVPGPQSLERGIGEASSPRPRARRRTRARPRLDAPRAGASSSASPHGHRARHDRSERWRRRQVVRDEQHRCDAPRRPGPWPRAGRPRGCPVGAQARRGRARAGRDAPVAGRRVVHRVVEARRRHVAGGAGERLADLVQHLAAPGGAGEHRRQLVRAGAARRERLGADVQRELDQVAAAAPLRRRQDLRGRARHLAGFVARVAREHRPRRVPAREAGGEQTDAVDVRLYPRGARISRCSCCRRSRTSSTARSAARPPQPSISTRQAHFDVERARVRPYPAGSRARARAARRSPR